MQRGFCQVPPDSSSRQAGWPRPACHFRRSRRPGTSTVALRCTPLHLPTTLLAGCPCVQGDVHHWTPLLDHFDSFFETYIKDRRDLQLTYGASSDAAGGGASGAAAAQQQLGQGGLGGQLGPPFPGQAVLQVLRVTTLILEGCSNKHLYNSYEASVPVLPVLPGLYHSAVLLAVHTASDQAVPLCPASAATETCSLAPLPVG